MSWFGQNYGAPIYSDTPCVDVPAGAACFYCQESIAKNDDGFFDAADHPFHRACWLRMVNGSLAHQLKMCTCFVPDSKVPHEPEGMTKREAAEAALRVFVAPKHMKEDEWARRRGKMIDERGNPSDKEPTDEDVFLICAGVWPNKNLGARQTRCAACNKFCALGPKGWELKQKNAQRKVLCPECFEGCMDLAGALGGSKP